MGGDEDVERILLCRVYTYFIIRYILILLLKCMSMNYVALKLACHEMK